MKIITTTLIVLFFINNTYSQCLSEEEWKKYFNDRIENLAPIEGIWSTSANTKNYDFYNRLLNDFDDQKGYKVAIYRNGSDFNVCLIGVNSSFLIETFNETAVKGVYLFKIFYPRTSSTVNGTAILKNDGILEFSYEVPKAVLQKMMGNDYLNGMRSIISVTNIKIYPKNTDYNNNEPVSGTGFALTSDGVIVTNHHVVSGANAINVRGINGDFSKTYKARVITEDKNNDLALIKIDNIDFTNLGTIPFIIPNKSSDVGSSIFCLGYPLRATMGDEVKLTNGIISSKSGFQGDITTYQITAAVQPGNSGGPLFDDKGNLIGIISAKHLGAENVSYAVKVSYLLSLIDTMPIPPKLQTVSVLTGKTLSDQVKLLKNYTYIIEAN